ncbi:hypothetical protein [Halobacillus seohaensis]|uniref:Integrase SAM-like N-terminal domain-containing protein n=1 Tax=Halobacillus seohaensis TaxID=447421 RepID=A0ABW2ERW7_9BACI
MPNHILPHFGHLKVINIKRTHINKWMNDYAERDYSFGARLRYLSIIKSIFHYG